MKIIEYRSCRIALAATYHEYFGQKIVDIASSVGGDRFGTSVPTIHVYNNCFMLLKLSPDGATERQN